jgi:hypothetical protein
VPAPTSPSLKIVKTIPWKGGIQEWSNRYFFDGAVPGDLTKWTTLADAIVLAERATVKGYVGFVGAVGYDGTSETAVFQKTYTATGSNTTINDETQSSEVVALVKFTTAKRSSKNHPVYLFKYMHGVWCYPTTTIDTLSPTQKALYETYFATWLTGFSDGTVNHKLCGPDGTAVLTRIVEPYVTHRDFR